ncbi:hypothetical protein SAMN05421882_106111 [Nitrosomonas communis]|uniref:Uncharacterized protein n=1 Tax=Nitrosomonas communis TaxID=44574 RepID=A0A1H2YYX9_9PROT|nr:hypothetical protein SAMN05421882_106111 [Nitrosomonas communis]
MHQHTIFLTNISVDDCSRVQHAQMELDHVQTA